MSAALAGVAAATLLVGTSGLPGLFLPRGSRTGQRAAAGLAVLGAAFGLWGAVSALLRPAAPGADAERALAWPPGGHALFGIDALSAFFLIPVFLFAALGSIYGLGYWRADRHPRCARKTYLFWGSMAAGMALLLVARDGLAFLLGWETMALSAFFLVSAEDERAESRRAGFVYVVATHCGTLILFGFFALWRSLAGSFALRDLAPGTDPVALGVLFLLALAGFGMKAGLAPLHFWLPGAHANAPSHVSAALSGVLLKMGVYGFLRFCFLMPSPPAFWGALVLFLGTASALYGVVFALGQHDLKRLLAYHSVENIGIIFMGLGLALLGRSTGRTEWLVLGTAGCLLHAWNHFLFKTLLFLAAGSALKGTGTKNIDVLGGLAKRMPFTAAAFLLGAVAICGLPPLNGFVSELFIYLGFLSPLSNASTPLTDGVLLAMPALAAVGALAVACFVKAYGSVFLGNPRSGATARAEESPKTMLLSMGVLAAACAAIGLFPAAALPLLDAAIAGAYPNTGSVPSVAAFVPFGALGAATAVFAGAVAAAGAYAFVASRRRRRAVTWDCGYAAPTGRMQYTATSFAGATVGLFAWLLRPKTRGVPVSGAFPGPSSLETENGDAVLDRALIPGALKLQDWALWFRRFQHGLTQNYILYIVMTLAVLLCTLVPFGELFRLLVSR